MTSKPLVLVVGATGRTGSTITQSLLNSGNFRVAALVRPSSINKPVVQDFKAAGVELRLGDISDAPDKLNSYLDGVDTLIITVIAMVDQKPIIHAAKKAGIKRLVPSDFGPPAAKGVMWMNDIKLEIRDLIKDLGIPYTFIDVGWWGRQMFPFPRNIDPKPNAIENAINNFMYDGNKKNAITAFESIGEFVVRIIADPRTLNKAVMTWDYETTLGEAWKLAESISGENYSDYPRQSDDEIKQKTTSEDLFTKILAQYNYSLYVRGDNTVENALALGDLDARALYPDYKPVTIEEEAKKFYANPPRNNFKL